MVEVDARYVALVGELKADASHVLRQPRAHGLVVRSPGRRVASPCLSHTAGSIGLLGQLGRVSVLALPDGPLPADPLGPVLESLREGGVGELVAGPVIPVPAVSFCLKLLLGSAKTIGVRDIGV